jgi:hypothetical protein
LGFQAQVSAKRSGEDTDRDRESTRYAEACQKLLTIERWVQHGSYAEILPSGRIEVTRYTTQQYEAERSALLDIISGFQEVTSETHEPRLVKVSGIDLEIPKRKRKKAVGFSGHVVLTLANGQERKFLRVNQKRHFGTAQRRALLRTGAMMSRLYPSKGQTYEVTLTIPGSTTSALKCVAAYTPWLTNRLMQVIRDLERKTGITLSWFYVWEWQERGALHMHMALGSSDGQLAKRAADEIEYRWFELLLELREMTGIDVFARSYGGTWRDQPGEWQSHVAAIAKNLAAYFAKYASKDKDTREAERNGTPVRFYPRTWWGRSRDLAAAVREQTIKVCLGYLTEDEAVTWYQRIDQILSHYNHIKEYCYDFSVERKLKDSSRKRCYAEGERRIRYYEDDVFEQVKDEVETLAAWMRAEARNNEWTGELPQQLAALSRNPEVECICA